jgi:Zn-finger nucleic acid-binding protein
MKYCPECGTKLETEWKNCPNCGTRVIEGGDSILTRPKPIQYPRQTQYNYSQDLYSSRDKSNVNGIVSLIFGILGLFALPLVGAIIAIIFGNLGKKKDADPSLANIGYVLGILGICCCCCLMIFPFMLISHIMF